MQGTRYIHTTRGDTPYVGHKKGTLNGCLMRKVRSFDQDPPVHPATAHPVYLLALRRLPQGSCFTLLIATIPKLSTSYQQTGHVLNPARPVPTHTKTRPGNYSAIACASTSARRALLPVSCPSNRASTNSSRKAAATSKAAGTRRYPACSAS